MSRYPVVGWPRVDTNERVDAPCADDRGMIARQSHAASWATHAAVGRGRRVERGSTVECSERSQPPWTEGGIARIVRVRDENTEREHWRREQHAPPPFCTSKLCTHGRRLCRGLNTNTGGGVVRKCAVRKGWAPPSAASTLAPIPTSLLVYYVPHLLPLLQNRDLRYHLETFPSLTPVASRHLQRDITAERRCFPSNHRSLLPLPISLFFNQIRLRIG